MLFQQRLRACVRKGDLQVADLHHWFDRPRATVRYWLLSKDAARYEPHDDPKGRDAWTRLKLLEWGVENNDGFPVPLSLSAHARPAYIRRTQDALSRGVSKRDLAKAGREIGVRHLKKPGDQRDKRPA